MATAAGASEEGTAARPGAPFRIALSTLVGLVGAATGGVAAAGMLGLVPGLSLGAALAAHGLAAIVACGAAAIYGSLRPSERTAILVTSLVAPLFGPALAWTFNRRCLREEAVNAHAHFESLENCAQFRRDPMTGNFDRDLSRELGVVSFAQILRQGSLDRKRNLLRRLAALGQPRHLEVIRHCLRDPEPELRLCAYAEVDRLSQEREDEIARLHAEIDVRDESETGDSSLDELMTEIAERCRSYATSGILDADMSRYWLQQAVKAASQALEMSPASWPATRETVLAQTEMQELDEAWTTLEKLQLPDPIPVELLLVQADLACRRRDFESARQTAGELRRRGDGVPEWLAALGTVADPAVEPVAEEAS